MSQVDQKDQAEQEKEHRTEESDVVAVDEEEAFRDEERQHDEPDPEQDFWTPESILNSGATISRGLDAEKQESEDQVEETKAEVDAVNCDPTVTFLSVAFDFHVVESQVLQLLEGPWSEHDPGDDRVD